MNDLIIKSIDKIISGDINKGIIPGDTIIVRDGKIAQIGRAENQRLHGRRRMKKRTEKHTPPVGTAPAGGEFSLPVLSAPNSRLGRVWVKQKSHRILHRKMF